MSWRGKPGVPGHVGQYDKIILSRIMIAASEKRNEPLEEIIAAIRKELVRVERELGVDNNARSKIRST